MDKSKKIKIIIGLFYSIFVGLFLYYFFSKFSLQEITSYDFIKNNQDYFSKLRQSNLILLATSFFLFVIVWVLAAGFGSPVIILGGFIFGKWLGTLIVILGLSVGSTLLYLFANYFLKDLIKDKFLGKYQNLEVKFKKSELLYLLIYRFIGGIPFAISNILPCMFNVKPHNFLFATFLGIVPQTFLICSIGSGLEKIIDNNLEAPRLFDLIQTPDLYIPIIAFITLLVFLFFLRKVFYRK
ncbi:MAG: TVP38/TMEM64 family protein [Candidatus Pelagibacter sp.]